MFGSAFHRKTADITLAAGERTSVSPDWKPKAMLTLNWPLIQSCVDNPWPYPIG
jgi:hypothetical protein